MIGKMIDRTNAALRKVPVWGVYLLGVLYPLWLLYLGIMGDLGPDPVKALEHDLGERALQLLILGLAVTPLRRFSGMNLMRFRRAIGVLTFTYVALHLLVWLVLDVQIISQILGDIAKRPYITIGMAGFLMLVPLGLVAWLISQTALAPRKKRRLSLVTVRRSSKINMIAAVHKARRVKGSRW
mgnify:CR=1 FL=1